MLAELYTLVREMYEAIVLVIFVQLIIIWLGGVSVVGRAFSRQMQDPQHIWFTVIDKIENKCPTRFSGCGRWLRDSPIRRIPMPFPSGLGLVVTLLITTLQYAAISLLVCMIDAVIWAYYVYMVDDDLKSREEAMIAAMKIPQLIKCVSIGVAFYGLLLLLFELERNHELHETFEKINPHAKFWCIKLLVFATAIQKFVFETALPKLGFFARFGDGAAIQNWLLLPELLVIAIWHFWAYPASDFPCTEEEASNISHTRSGTFWDEVRWIGPWGMLLKIQDSRNKANRQRGFKKNLAEALANPGTLSDEMIDVYFGSLDVDRNGEISKPEFEHYLGPTLQRYSQEQEIADFWTSLDADGNGVVTKEEFTNFLKNVKNVIIRDSSRGSNEAPLLAPLLAA